MSPLLHYSPALLLMRFIIILSLLALAALPSSFLAALAESDGGYSPPDDANAEARTSSQDYYDELLVRTADACANYGDPDSEAWGRMIREAGPTALRLELDVAEPRRTMPGDGEDEDNDDALLPWDRVAVIIEPRPHPCFGIVVRSVLHYLGDGWGLQVFHGPDNEDYIVDALTLDCSGLLPAGEGASGGGCVRDASVLERVRLSNVGEIYDQVRSRSFDDATMPDWLTRHWHDLDSEMDSVNNDATSAWGLTRHAYSEILLSPQFWSDDIMGENVLIFQTDSFLCRDGVDGYLDYDYVGAPWRLCGMEKGKTKDEHYLCVGGNGGLSLRRRSVMLRLIEEGRRSLVMEDFQFADWMFRERARGSDVRLLSFSDGRDVFVETLVPNGPDVVPLGVHKPFAYLGERELRGLLDRCMLDLRRVVASEDDEVGGGSGGSSEVADEL